MGMTDDELLAAFERGEIDGADFPHEMHVRVARLLSNEPGGFARLRAGIRGIAERAERPQAYHETVTRAWFELISSAAQVGPELYDRGLLSRYYSEQALASGRRTWVEPDLHPLRLPPPPRPIADLVGAMRNVPTAVAVLAAHAGGIVHASTVSSATSVSRQPPLVLVCLSPESRALGLVREAGSFALSFLASGQDRVAAHFADPARAKGQFSEIPHSMTPFGPVIENAAATLGCMLAAEHEGGDHRIVIGEVHTAAAADSHPLLRHAGAFR